MICAIEKACYKNTQKFSKIENLFLTHANIRVILKSDKASIK
jgi:hypothetical protein